MTIGWSITRLVIRLGIVRRSPRLGRPNIKTSHLPLPPQSVVATFREFDPRKVGSIYAQSERAGYKSLDARNFIPDPVNCQE
ncbi:MAG: hypothetical protein ACRC8Y_18320 [Chroococcales cyanobacterium]